ncbi:unnamed protein product [Rotaria magnacalcarata]|uniref:Tafazzin family protein n=1 Tax=Rotaria magnacalcarata TaxID=392030 RepID=A0A814H249_9BILA|nr:unnamed protein product [Rotaria magnacalcarata]CAF1287328.1 unnamed protein product [Rotaria magnacalcarata]CAF2037430.1 unnamed protein product [Rotaria magnacalcarata]CAF2151098.1 unnamed protein product [Rotaria magnacalcarata]CAF2156152.1 unnamed protein product [Rotaria magnacalcarata]
MPLSFDWPIPENPTRYYRALSTATIALVGTVSKLWMKYLTSVRIENADILCKAVLHRDPKRALLTAANHHSCLDEPLLFGASAPYRAFLNRQRMRWTLGAADVVFTKKSHRCFFTLGKTIPITRGDGVYQRSMTFALEQINQGEWVHIFPEAKINLTKELIRLKWGIGRLIAEANVCPLVVPFYHLGMDSVLPNVEPYFPKIGQKVSIYIGEPLTFDDLVEKMRKENRSLQEMRKAITDIIQNEFAKLKSKCEELHRLHLAGDTPSLSSKN